MSPIAHRIYIGCMSAVVIATTCYLSYVGYDYYQTPIEGRYDHPRHAWFKPSGPFGHGLGIIGTLLILGGVVMYMVRKRKTSLAHIGRLKYWLEFHIFLCTLGPIMILFHTSFKFGGIVSIAFWSMVAVVASGVIGRFIYLQIPRSIEGRELSLQEVQHMKMDLRTALQSQLSVQSPAIDAILNKLELNDTPKQGNVLVYFFSGYLRNRQTVASIHQLLKTSGLVGKEANKVTKMIAQELSLNQKIGRLLTMQKLFRYWHVAHLPFAIIMLIVVVIHVAVTLLFGYKWIF
jgi:hypothetical protein